MSGIRLNVLAIILITLLLFLQFRLWFEKDGIRDMQLLKQTLAKQSQQNDQLKKMNEDLLFQIQRLKDSKDATEAHARNELGMIKRDETFYQVVKS